MKIVKVFFDEWDVTQYCHVRNISTMLQAPRTNVFQTHPDRDGAYFKQSTLGQIVVEIKVSIRSNTLDNLDRLNTILQSREPKRLYIDDRPDRYLMAILDNGSIPVSGRYYASTLTLKFISPDAYWRSNHGAKTIALDSNGRAILDDIGTADTPLSMEVDFESDCGHLAIVTPNSHIELGNPEEVDIVAVPPSEFAVNEEMDDMSAWTKLTTTDLPKYIYGSDAIMATGLPKTDEWGLVLNKDWPTIAGKWNGVLYKKDFAPGIIDASATNFQHRSRIDLEDLSGDTGAGVLFNFAIYDTNQRFLMGLYISDAGLSKNELTVRFLIGSSNPNDKNISYMVHTKKIGRIRGWVSMDKMGDQFTWRVHNDSVAPPPSVAPPAMKVGDIVHLKQSATTIYDWNGNALRLNNIIKGIPLRVSAVRSSPKGRYQLTNVNKGWVEGFFEADAIQEATVTPPKSPTSSGPEQIEYKGTYSDRGQSSGAGISVGMFKFYKNPGYSVGSINSTVIKRIHTSNTYDIPNTFMAKDKLTINDSEILLNGSVFDGQISYDSRPLYIEGGVSSQIALLPSSWASMPKAKVTYESRWLS